MKAATDEQQKTARSPRRSPRSNLSPRSTKQLSPKGHSPRFIGGENFVANIESVDSYESLKNWWLANCAKMTEQMEKGGVAGVFEPVNNNVSKALLNVKGRWYLYIPLAFHFPVFQAA